VLHFDRSDAAEDAVRSDSINLAASTSARMFMPFLRAAIVLDHDRSCVTSTRRRVR